MITSFSGRHVLVLDRKWYAFGQQPSVEYRITSPWETPNTHPSGCRKRCAPRLWSWLSLQGTWARIPRQKATADRGVRNSRLAQTDGSTDIPLPDLPGSCTGHRLTFSPMIARSLTARPYVGSLGSPDRREPHESGRVRLAPIPALWRSALPHGGADLFKPKSTTESALRLAWITVRLASPTKFRAVTVASRS